MMNGMSLHPYPKGAPVGRQISISKEFSSFKNVLPASPNKRLQLKLFSLNKEIAKSARLDRRNHLIEQFNENPNDPNKTGLWRAVRQLKTKFIPHYVQMKNGAGERVPLPVGQKQLQNTWKQIIG